MVNFHFHITDYLNSAPKIIQLVWFLSTVFLVVIMGLLTYLSYIRKRLRLKNRIESVYKKKYEIDLIEYLFAGEGCDEATHNQQIIINYLKKCAKSSLKRKLIISTLLKLRNEISGETADAIQRLYCQTGLVDHAVLKLKSKEWHVIAEGIMELTHFEIKNYHDEIIQHINHPKRKVRKEIQMYLVSLFQFEGLQFLSILTNKLSEWDQIQLLELLKNFDDQQTQDIPVWLASENNSVVSFSLKLAKTFNQYETKKDIVALLYHPEEAIRVEAISVLSHFNDIDSLAILKKEYTNRTINEQVAIFKMIENVHDFSDILFVLAHDNDPNFEIKFSANKILKEFDHHQNYNVKKNIIEIDESKGTSLIQAS